MEKQINEDEYLLEGDAGVLRNLPRSLRLGNVALTSPEENVPEGPRQRLAILLGTLGGVAFAGGLVTAAVRHH